MAIKKKNKKANVCKHEGCNNKPAPQRRECYKCRSRAIIKRKPIDMCFYWLKKSAKKRHLSFTITLQWFRNYITSTGYMENRGRLADSLSIDRKDNLIGYEPYNLQILTKSENTSKFHQEDMRRELGVQYEGEVPF